MYQIQRQKWFPGKVVITTYEKTYETYEEAKEAIRKPHNKDVVYSIRMIEKEETNGA